MAINTIKVKKVPRAIWEIILNTKKLISFSWEMDSKLVLLYYITTFIGAIIPLLASILMKIIIDQLQISQTQNLSFIPLVIFFFLATRYVIHFGQYVILYGINYTYLDFLFRWKLQNTITYKFHKKISQMDISYFEDPKIQDIITKVRDTMKWRVPDQLRQFSYLFRDIVIFSSGFIVLLGYSWWIPIAATIITLPRLYLRARYGAIQWSIWGSGAPQVRKLWYFDYLLQDPISVKEMRIAQSSKALLEKFKGIQNHLFDLNKKPLDRYLKIIIYPPILEMIFLYIVASSFLEPVISESITIGTFTLIISMLDQINGGAASAASKLGELYESNFYVNQYFEFLNLPKKIKSKKNAVKLDIGKPPKIEFKNVSFSYPGGTQVLENLSFVINPGESVAFVGHNGAGKSTIIKLLCRFYDVSDGEILINGINLKDIKLSNWYKFLGTLFQEFSQYHFTVGENITLTTPDKKSKTEMIEAAKKSGASEFIDNLPDKYNQILGREFEDGVELSIGQWQKLAIARAFYQKPPVLILDEPTSAIDAEAEYEIFNNLEKQYKNKTLILVSHRFSTVRNANKIMVIENGKIIEGGTHQKLLDAKGKYARMFELQAKGYK